MSAQIGDLVLYKHDANTTAAEGRITRIAHGCDAPYLIEFPANKPLWIGEGVRGRPRESIDWIFARPDQIGAAS